MTATEPLNYDFFTAPRIAFGWGRAEEVGVLAKHLGRRVFLVSGSKTLAGNGVLDRVEAALRHENLEVMRLASITREPEVNDVDNAVKSMLNSSAGAGDMVLAVGGGSAIDLAKAASALVTNREGSSVRDYLEGVGSGLEIVNPPVPMLAMPTTAGTGSEVTKNAVISSYDPPFKKSLRSEWMVPRVVLIDPELSTSVPPEVTAQTGMDAITQLIESYVSNRAKPIPQALCLQGLELALPSIVEAVQDGSSQCARENMAHAAMLSGMALANSGLGMAHGVAAALGIHCHVPHGLACAVMLPVALEVNREVSHNRLVRLVRLAALHTPGQTLTGDDAVTAFIESIKQISRTIGIPERLSEIGVQKNQIPEIVRSSRGNSMSGNPRELADDELSEILEGML